MNEEQWEEYRGEYEKTWYDVQLATGEVIRDCWPNAGSFHSFHEVDCKKGGIEGSTVVKIRKTDDPFFRKHKKS